MSGTLTHPYLITTLSGVQTISIYKTKQAATDAAQKYLRDTPQAKAMIVKYNTGSTVSRIIGYVYRDSTKIEKNKR